MKKKFILFPVVGLLLYILLSSYSEGPDHWGNVDGTGATNPGGCSCHNSGVAATTTTVALELDSAGISVSRYTGGHSYTVKITGTNTSGTTLTWFGFQICVIKTGTSGGSAVNAGTFASTGLPTSTQKVSAGTAGVIGGSGLPVDFMEHSAPINVTSGGPYTESFSWTAPAAGTGSITIYGAVNPVNHDGSADAGDLWNNNNVTFCENVSAITGTATVCAGATVTLSDATTGGTWSSGNTTIATVTSGGAVTGVSAGTAVISYSAGCSGGATTIVTVNASSTISGTLNVCQGATTGLTDGSGTWTSSTTGVATVGATTGIVTGVITGTTSPATTVITFTPSSAGCGATSTVTVNPLPAVITGIATVCQGATTTLTETTTGGTWSSGSSSVATINATGVVTGVVTGSTSATTAVITYTSSSGCIRTTTVTVNPLPASITGTASVCQGATTALGETTTGGTWGSSSTGIATVNSSGVVTGVVTGSTSAATTVITYTSGGCSTTATVTVNGSPAAISGTTILCPGSTTTLIDATTGGTWSSNNTTVASIGLATGLLTAGASPGGTAIITYTSTAGCSITTIITVNPQPAPIGGTTSICSGATTTLTDATTGGTWSSSNATVASIGLTSGTLAGGANPGGTASVSYTVSGCSASTVITVNPSPAGITGSAIICAGTTTTLNDATTGGTWGSSSTTVGTIGLSSGIFTGNPGPGGTSVITYNPGTGCLATIILTVNPIPSSISGVLSICPGTTTTLIDGTTGGTWSSGNTTVASIGLTSGLLTGGVSPGGTASISYIAGGCSTSASITVNTSPPVILGTTTICAGTSTTLSDAITGGTWSSNNTVVATIGLNTGLLTGGAGAGGAAIITYTSPAGCAVETIVIVNPLPPGITGVLAICSGATTTLIDGTTGGTWSSSTTAATIGLTSGIVTGAAGTGGTTLITYTSPAGCTTTTTVTVNPLPSSITGTTNVCSGSSTALADGTTGGTWSSNNTGIATVLPGTGSVNGIGTGGTATISYTLATSCAATTTVTVNPLPPGISGTASVCVGLTSSLTDGTSGGTWSSGNTATATVVTGSGLVSGAAPGTSTITYALPTGCTTSKVVTTNPLPSVISGTTTVCAGLTTLLGNTTTGGTWSSSNTTVATVGLSSGNVSGLLAGTTTITYSVGAGCTIATVVTVNPLSPITGATSVCTGSSATLSDATSGGTWASSTTTVTTVTPATGSYTGIVPGTSSITYTLSTGCTASAVVSVVSTPAPITGPANVCIGSSIGLTDGGFGTWTSGSTGIATVSSSGNVFGVSGGTATITYSLGTSCNVTYIVTVNTLPGAILGTAHACPGSTTLLSDATSGGTWSSSNTGVATIATSPGNLTGVSNGTSIITYMLATGCTSTAVITINPSPGAIGGTPNICIGATTTLTDGSSAGTWSSSLTGTATVSPAGVVSGAATGTSTIIYTLPITGCTANITVTVNSLPPSITGASGVCIGSTATLIDGTTGGTWSSSSTGTATVGSASGIISGVFNGTSTITYSLGAGCTVSKTITVNALPLGISGPTTVCTGSAILLTDGTTGGTWSSGNTTIATVLPGSGSATGTSPGADTIFYKLTSTGCARALTISVNPSPSGITGSTSICLGTTVSLTDASTGGTWSSSNTVAASVALTTGDVAGLSPGTSTITYKLSGCTATAIVTVNGLPSLIIGTLAACQGSTVTLADATTGGTWSSSTSSIATVLTSPGTVTGVSPGVDTITYTAPLGCSRSVNVTIDPVPSSISGTTSICSGSTASLSDVTTGGTWSSSSTSTATIGITSGTLTGGLLSGTATITYRLSTGCSATANVTVNPLPLVITGIAAVCTGATTTLIDGTSAGTWSSSSTGIATVDGIGTVTGVTPGTATIAYILGSGCTRTTIVTVNPIPLSITGTGIVCAGSTITLGDGTTGGTWSSSTTGVATVIAGSGTVTGIIPGTAIINYTLSGCSTSAIATVNPIPSSILGVASVCAGATTTLTDVTTGGTWSSGATSIATVGTSSGIVSGISASDVTISYTNSVGCSATQIVTVNAIPGSISGITSVCSGSTITLTDPGGGTWSSSNTTIATAATIGGSGVIAGESPGTVNISYILLTGCAATTTVTVNPSPLSIIGTATICEGTTSALIDGSTGGTWSSGSTGTATVSAGGVVNGVLAGTTSITYTLGSGCNIHTIITVNPSPAAITGTMSVCDGSSTLLSDLSGTGTWSSNATGVATVDGTGNVTAVSPGVATIAYSFASGCSSTAVVTINPLPAAIAGTAIVCVGGTTALTDPTSGGAWSSGDVSIATVGTSTGIVTGVAETSVTITYTLPTGCAATIAVTDDCNVGVRQISFPVNSLNIIPNPNIGVFTIVGSISSVQDEIVMVEITDMVGRVVNKEYFIAKNGQINKQIALSNNLANGIYLLNLCSENENGVLHFAIEK